MSIAYLILAHKNPEQLLSLVKSIYNTEDFFVIHLDVRSDIVDFQKLLINYERVVFLNERWQASWGSYELVEATLSGLKFIRNIQEIARIVMLSGQDYPIKEPAYIKKYLAEHPSEIFMECFSIPCPMWKENGISRFPNYNKVKEVMDLYAGSQWISFPYHIISIIFDFLELNPLFITYFKSVFIPDESFFQTLLMNCGIDDVINEIVGINLHLISWGKQKNHPNVLNNEDVLLILQSERLFARKFEGGSSPELLLYIHENVLTQKKTIDLPKQISHLRKDVQVICFLTNRDNADVLNRYYKLKTEVANLGDTRIFFHQDCLREISCSLQENDPFVFTSQILSGIGYKSIFDNVLTGSNHFPLLKFFRENPDYDYYWYIEDDVYYTNGWDKFFGFFLQNTIQTDFITTHIREYENEPGWFWWDTLKFKSMQQSDTFKVRSFNPLFRISNKALRFIDDSLKQGWEGHYEVLLPTLLKTAGFSIAEFGGRGKYVLPGCENKFYTTSDDDNLGRLATGSFRYRPVIKEEEMVFPLIYHPVKISH